MNLLFRLLGKWPAERGTWFAALVSLLGLSLMVTGLLYPLPWVVVLSMMGGQTLAGLAFLLYGLSIGADIVQNREKLAPPPAEPRKP